MLALHGVDLYIVSSAVPEAPAESGSLKRIFISDRGTRVQNAAEHDTSRTEIYCVRYESESAITDADVDAFVTEISSKGLKWPKVQKLFRFENGDKAYSQPY
jgi:hypothetical protein